MAEAVNSISESNSALIVFHDPYLARSQAETGNAPNGGIIYRSELLLAMLIQNNPGGMLGDFATHFAFYLIICEYSKGVVLDEF
ncbi:hypothetical protein LU631_04680 [Erwinia tracheiphila]|uniref:hypothetical protein n=1 Tax=Erwinia tracheiphila TaxID=65700 RepID=UPI00033CEEC2|nr:hypothetical protein [Erwinia tracheiphila]EOS95562.1 hypothetical protein ETR_07676 [Erwinia tracheiphila PSU-1]UIA83060.1 hypothetical protein LU604_22215 [Erwinia tracheiphila]UIA90231.1 hypothetical protein LU631_04680 [Erwinia tracheiphila]UIA91638.1 hypothetical protein LU632_21675 [Erwinia tracheiphila]UIA98762.1 hypothetical protein LU633_03355 [Erwinia tracheiphila]